MKIVILGNINKNNNCASRKQTFNTDIIEHVSSWEITHLKLLCSPILGILIQDTKPHMNCSVNHIKLHKVTKQNKVKQNPPLLLLIGPYTSYQ